MSQDRFILSAFDLNLWCPVLENRFAVDDLEALQAIIDWDIDADPNFVGGYNIEPDELSAINQRFDVGFDPDSLELTEIEVWLEREPKGRSIRDIPYLVHTRFELPLMLEGRKQLASFTNIDTDTEAAFDRWIDKSVLHKEVFLEPVPESLKPYLIDPNHMADREVYYAVKGEEWRIPAMRLLWREGLGWNEHFERLEGMLFGYESWQNDWWIAHCNERGGIGGIAFFCTVDAEGLRWMELAGFRALPPFGRAEIPVRSFHPDDETAMASFLAEDEDAVALARFKLLPKRQQKMLEDNANGPWQFTREQIPEINRHLKRQVDILLRRSEG